MEKIKPILVLALAALMLLCGCSGNKSVPTDSNNSTTVKEETSSTVDKSPGEEVQPKEEKKLEEITFLTKDYYTQPEFAQKLEEMFFKKTGVKLSINHVQTNNWEEKVTAAFVSGDMPDVSRIDSNIYPYIKQEFIVPLGEYIEDNGAMKLLFEKNPGVIEPFKFFDDVYAVSISNPKSMTVWVRGDWLDKLNIGHPTNMDEFVEMLKRFRDEDLDGNGKNDTIPLTLSATLKNYDCIAAYFGVRSEIYMKDGKAVDPIPTQEYKEYMDFMRMLYSEKLIDQEMPTNTSYGSVRTKFNTGMAASIIMWDDIYDSLTKGLAQAEIKDAYVEPLTAFEGDKGVFGYSYYTADSPIAITSQAEDPKAVFDTFFTWYFTDPDAIIATCQGIEGYSFDVVDGVMVPNEDNGGVGFKGQSLPPVMRDFKFPFKLSEINQKEYEYIIEIGEQVDKYLDKVATFPPDPSFAEYYNIKEDLGARVKDLFFNYVMGQIDYDKFIADYNAYKNEINLDGILAEINK